MTNSQFDLRTQPSLVAVLQEIATHHASLTQVNQSCFESQSLGPSPQRSKVTSLVHREAQRPADLLESKWQQQQDDIIYKSLCVGASKRIQLSNMEIPCNSRQVSCIRLPPHTHTHDKGNVFHIGIGELRVPGLAIKVDH